MTAAEEPVESFDPLEPDEPEASVVVLSLSSESDPAKSKGAVDLQAARPNKAHNPIVKSRDLTPSKGAMRVPKDGAQGHFNLLFSLMFLSGVVVLIQNETKMTAISHSERAPKNMIDPRFERR